MSPVDIYLLRGLGRESAHWGDFIPLLESQKFVRSVKGIDLLGMGRFYNLTSPARIQDNADFLLSQIDPHTDVVKVVISMSLGAMVGVEAAQKQPNSFAKLFVINTSFANLSPIYHRLQLKAWRHFFMIARTKNLLQREKEVLTMVSRSSDKHEKVAREWAEIAMARPVAISNFLRQLLAAARYKLADEPPQTPVVVLNSQGDEMVHPSCSEKLASVWNLPLFTHPTAGHDICTDDPDWVIEQVAQNLSHPQSRIRGES